MYCNTCTDLCFEWDLEGGRLVGIGVWAGETNGLVTPLLDNSWRSCMGPEDPGEGGVSSVNWHEIGVKLNAIRRVL